MKQGAIPVLAMVGLAETPKAVMQKFHIYSVYDFEFSIGKNGGAYDNEECQCLDGMLLDPADPRTCTTSAAGGTVNSCTEVFVSGPAHEIADVHEIADGVSTYYDDCIVYWVSFLTKLAPLLLHRFCN
jgi:hypothetical protein